MFGCAIAADAVTPATTKTRGNSAHDISQKLEGKPGGKRSSFFAPLLMNLLPLIGTSLSHSFASSSAARPRARSPRQPMVLRYGRPYLICSTSSQICAICRLALHQIPLRTQAAATEARVGVIGVHRRPVCLIAGGDGGAAGRRFIHRHSAAVFGHPGPSQSR